MIRLCDIGLCNDCILQIFMFSLRSIRAVADLTLPHRRGHGTLNVCGLLSLLSEDSKCTWFVFLSTTGPTLVNRCLTPRGVRRDHRWQNSRLDIDFVFEWAHDRAASRCTTQSDCVAMQVVDII